MRCNGYSLRFQFADSRTVLACRFRRFLCHSRCKDAFRRTRKEFYQPRAFGACRVPDFMARTYVHMGRGFPAAKTVSAFSEPLFSASKTFDGVTGATPLSSLKAGTLPTETFADLFFGFKGGCIGEICCAALLLGGIYLLVRRVITWHIPVAYIGTVALLTFLFHMKGGQAVFFDFDFMLAEILSGGLFLGAFFMATDYSTSPATNGGRLIFGIGCGVLTVALRYFGGMNEGVSYSILIMNVFAFVLDRVAKPRRYGKKEAAASEK